MTAITREKNNKKLCINCDHCIIKYPMGDAYNPIYFCGRKEDYFSNIDGNPTRSCETERGSTCKGKFYQNSDKKFDTQKEVDDFIYELGVEKYMNRAREVVENGETCYISCGYLQEAVKRVRAS